MQPLRINLQTYYCLQISVKSTVPFNSVRQSRVTGPSKSPKCHVGHGNFYKVPKSFCDLALNYRNFLPPAAQNCGKFPNVTVSLGGCRNQNFVRRVTRHMGCRSELNGTVVWSVFAFTQSYISTRDVQSLEMVSAIKRRRILSITLNCILNLNWEIGETKDSYLYLGLLFLKRS